MPVEPLPPDKLLNETNRGGDTQRRYRYQAAYAALVSLDLLNVESEFEEIFCEHYEDILVKRKDNTFIGIQVKTREVGRGSFTFNDPEVINSIGRFIKCEQNFPKFFKSYVLAASCGFWKKRKRARC